MTCDDFDLGFSTRAIRAGLARTPEGEHAEPIFTTSSFVFASATQAAARFLGDEEGNIYSRFTNPTVRTVQDRADSLIRLSVGLEDIADIQNDLQRGLN